MSRGDVYNNTLTVNSSKAIKLTSNTARVSVVNRSISGKLWHDTNHDGQIDATEPGIDKVHVHLWDVSGSTPKLVTENIEGEDLSQLTADSDGNYTFNHLPAGSYQVGVSQTDMTAQGLSATKLKANAADLSQDSLLDVSQTATLPDGTSDVLLADQPTLPATANIDTSGVYKVSDENAGFLKETDGLSLIHVPKLDFGKHNLPTRGATYDNENETSNYVEVVDARPADTAQTPYALNVHLSDFTTVGLETPTVGLSAANIQFLTPDDTHIAMVNGGAVTPEATSILWQHDDTTEADALIHFGTIQLAIPAQGQNNAMRIAKYQADMTYELTVGVS